MTVQERPSARHQIIIVGGGAGGLELATRLGGTLSRRGLADVTLVDAALSHLWKPLLHEVAAGSLNSHEDDIGYLAHAHAHHFRFRLGRLAGVDRARRLVCCAPALDERGDPINEACSFPYDTLVVAIGSITNDFGVPGVAEHCMFLDTRQQADRFHRHLLKSCYAANSQSEPLRDGQLHVAIAGAGATGVELAAELHDSLHQLAEFGLERIEPERNVRISIIEAAPRVLPGLPERISKSTHTVLEGLGITVYTGERICAAGPDGFRTDSGRLVPAAMKIWAAGIKAPDVLAQMDGLEVDRVNRLVVRGTLQTTRDDDIFAFGDCASCRLPGTDLIVPPRAQAAHQQATLLARSIAAKLRGAALPEYRYTDHGSLINMSRYETVGSLMGNLLGKRPNSLFIEGALARLTYLSLYKMHQFALHGYFRTALLTLADLLTRQARPRLKLH